MRLLFILIVSPFLCIGAHAQTLEQLGYSRIANVVPNLVLGQPMLNAETHIRAARKASGKGAQIVTFPEMSLTGYTVGDLVGQSYHREAVREALGHVVDASKSIDVVLVLGMPWEMPDGGLHNAAVVIHGGKILGVVTKSYLPNSGEFQEGRWMRSGLGIKNQSIHDPWFGDVVVGTHQVFMVNTLKFAVEICEDGWAPLSPSVRHTLAGAQLILNLSASNGLVGKAAKRRQLVLEHSERRNAAYSYVSSGPGESSTDLVFDGHQMVAELGNMLSESRAVAPGQAMMLETQIYYTDIDREKIDHARLVDMTWQASVQHQRQQGVFDDYRYVSVQLSKTLKGDTSRVYSQTPFVPNDGGRLSLNSEEALTLMTAGLVRRLQSTHSKNMVIGISGGSDSTLALLVAVGAADALGWDRKQVVGITMPGFGTTAHTKGSAKELMEVLGVTMKDISIIPMVTAEFGAIGHDPEVTDRVYENAQARERTQVLFDTANQMGGIVVGTGDLSELCLGWCTFNGDHMSSYGVNASVPKTLVKYLIRTVLDRSKSDRLRAVLQRVLDTLISPELLPPGKDGTIVQLSEDTVGDYRVVDFILYYLLHDGFSPAKIFYIAHLAFGKSTQGGVTFTDDELRDSMQKFYRRFPVHQFKRTASPAGPKIGSVSISPRVPLRLPDELGCESMFRFNELQLPEGAKI